MWPSQNFLLYIRNIIKIKVTKWINNFKKICQYPPPLWEYIQGLQIITIQFQKRANDFNTRKYNHKCTKEINLMPFKRFSISKFFC